MPKSPTPSRWRSIEAASQWAQAQGLRTQQQWKAYLKSGLEFPSDIPRAPDQAYGSAFGGWGVFLGTGQVATQHKRDAFVGLEEAAQWAQAQGITSAEHWLEKCREEGWRPAFIPANPSDAYGAKAFQAMGGWPGFLNLPGNANRSRIERAVKWVMCDVFGVDHRHDQDRVTDLQGKIRLVDCAIPHPRLIVEYDGGRFHAHRREQDAEKTQALTASGWTVVRIRGNRLLPIQLGLDVSVKESQAPAQQLTRLLEHILTLEGLGHLCLPAAAKDRVQGWLGGQLETFNFREIIQESNAVMPLEEAALWARTQGVTSQRDWYQRIKQENWLPDTIPRRPDLVYRDSWESWGAFLDTGRVAHQKRAFGSLEDVSAWAQAQGLTSKSQWFNHVRGSPDLPDWVPADPAQHFKQTWPGWPTFLGKTSAVLAAAPAPIRARA